MLLRWGLGLVFVVAGLGLIWEVRASLSMISGLLLFFARALWCGVLRSLEIDCGCLSPGGELGPSMSACARPFTATWA